MACVSALMYVNGSRGGVAADGDVLCDCIPRKYRHRCRSHVALMCPCGCTERLVLLNRFGNEPELSVILFTLDETSYSRELAPLAGHYPILKLGPPWWFFDSPEGMLRFRRETTETAGFYNTVGFNDDTRAFLSIPARHDMARRIDCRFLAELVCEHRLSEEEAHETAIDLAYRLVKKAYRL